MSRPSRAEGEATTLLNTLGCKETPIPVEQIAIARGAQVTYEVFDGEVSGMLIRDGERAIIGVNSSHAPVRQRFTIAHEIGHLIMHEGTPVFVDRLIRINRRDGTTSKQERDANAFAAELLMPRGFITARVAALTDKSSGIAPERLMEQLAEEFGVSVLAMSYRLANLDITDPYPVD
ncbi:MAG TPA: ImmA/IrrE family metallo-endopeptidase [Solirubrobacteraceae bacterium]|nr:ImmA/IrrE family metallo-endopeptidase [Solirubrobacteraceae bacterium]